ncbi:hypothetical protein C8J57DRAFT_1729933 [Mycena rebaudengoi]|nr:hypothetical protein C8J57DRAFT_1729933 [Mycena rebaudengoi]
MALLPPYRCTSRPLFLNLMVNTCAFKIQAICGPDTVSVKTTTTQCPAATRPQAAPLLGFGEIKIGTLQDLNLHLRLFHSQIFPFGDSKLVPVLNRAIPTAT